MESQMDRTHQTHSAVEGEGDHHEKKSVFKKVKAKARKIKGTLGIKSHGHDHDNINEHAEHDNEEDEEYEEDDELDQDPDIHGAPMYESAAAKNSVAGQEGNGVQPRDNLGTKSQFGQDLDQNVCPGTFQTKVTDPDVPVTPKKYDANSGQFKGTSGQLFGKDYNAEKHERQDVSPTNAGKADESAAPRSYTDQGDSPGEFKVTSGKHFDVDQNPPRNQPQNVSPANKETKATNPAGTGGEEDGVTPILKSFGKMDINDEPPLEKDSTTTGSHDQISQTPDWSSNKSSTIPDNTSVPESFNARTENYPQDMNVDEPAKQESGYTGTISSVTSAIALAKNAVASKIGYGATNDNGTGSPMNKEGDDAGVTMASTESVREPASTENYPQDMNVDEPAKQQSGYTGRISSVTSAIALAKNAVASKIGYGATNDNGTGSQMNKEGDDAGVPMASTESVREPAVQQSSYTDKISSATSAFAGTAVSAKNVVTSKLGYGGNNNPSSPMASEMNKGTPTSPTSSEMSTGGENVQTGGGVTAYGRQIASTVTDKLAPVYGKVAGVGSAGVSKLPGTGNYKNAGTDSDTHTNTGSESAGVPVETGSSVGGITDKGVAVKGYIADKLKPGEEDKALSDIISGAFHKRGKGVDEEEKKDMGVAGSDAFHKRSNDDEMERENKPMGKVTESEEVANRLGSSESEKLGKVSGSQSPGGTGVVDKFKGAFTNWFGKGGETNPSQAFNDSNQSHDATGEQDISNLGRTQ